ncbi:MAG: RimK/LysX family protein [Motiliproteus sp.]
MSSSRSLTAVCLFALLVGCSSHPNMTSPTTAAESSQPTQPATSEPATEATAAVANAPTQPQECPQVKAQQCPKPSADSHKIVIGEAERLLVSPPGVTMAARIDTGATTTSIDAREIQQFERDGKNWVRFVLVDDKKQRHTLERPISRIVEIKRHGGDNLERPVVMLKLELAGEKLNTEVSLTDRDNFEFGLLIGRNFLKDTFVVDVSKAYAQKTSAVTKGADQ